MTGSACCLGSHTTGGPHMMLKQHNVLSPAWGSELRIVHCKEFKAYLSGGVIRSAAMRNMSIPDKGRE